MFIYSTSQGLFPLNYKRKIAVIAKPDQESMLLILNPIAKKQKSP